MMRGLFAAIAFLTTIPVPRRLLGDEPASPSAMLWWWAPVGGLIGAIAAAVMCLANLALPWIPCAAIGVVALVVLSGGLHLEGFMDTCDGLGSRAPRERALEIMKDPRAGAFGVIGAICLLLVKFALVAGMEPYWAVRAIALAPVAGRLLQVATLHKHNYARPEGGMGKAFFSASTSWRLAVATTLAVAAALGFGSILGLYGLVCACVLAVIGARLIARRLGGHTGDTVGAMSELAEVAFLLAFTAFVC